MKRTLICTVTAASLALQGCQNVEKSDISNDDWIVGAWTTQSMCGHDDVAIFEDNGVYRGYYTVGAWRLKNDVLTITALYENETDKPLKEVTEVRTYSVKSHDDNRSMITSANENSKGQLAWINCAHPSNQIEFGINPQAIEAAQPELAPPSPPIDSEKSTASFNSKEQSLINAFFNAEDMCRGSSDQNVIDLWCSRRDSAYKAMVQAGICYGESSNKASFENKVHRCR